MPKHDWAVVLGASSGVGAAIATALAEQQGFNIFAVHRGNHPDGAARVHHAVERAGRRCEMWVHDAGNAAAAEAGVAEFARRLGGARVRVLVYSVASCSVGTLTGPDALAPRQIEASFDRMAHGFVYWIAALQQAQLLAPNARLIGLTNIMTEVVIRGTALVAASKAALHQYVRHLARELGPQGHRVNLLKFGYVATPAVVATFPSPEAQASLERTMRRSTPAHQLTDPQEVADAVAWLTSEAADRFNGAEIDFTGAESQGFFDALIYP